MREGNQPSNDYNDGNAFAYSIKKYIKLLGCTSVAKP